MTEDRESFGVPLGRILDVSPGLPTTDMDRTVEHRTVPPTAAAGIREIVDLEDLLPWYQRAFGELYASVAGQDLCPSGPSGGLFSSDLFQYERGEAIVFVPVVDDLRPIGRVTPLVIPSAELAVTVHRGDHADIDVTYGALGTYVAKHEMVVDGPVREYYSVDARTTEDAALAHCWDINKSVGHPPTVTILPS